ncbi:MAG TPA: methyltransferase [Bacteroidales bacterium]|nr:methyltransferase [Bacteroidales bacterium]
MGNERETKIREKVNADPSHILNVGMGFFASKTLLTAVKLNLFSVLATRPLTANDIKYEICLNGRGLLDFLDALVALGFLERKGKGDAAVYSNTNETNMFLDKNKMTYVGGILEMANNRLYPFWNYLEDALRTGSPQNETRTGRKTLFEEIYSDLDKTREFVNAMSGIQADNFRIFANKFDFSSYRTLCDLGGAGAQLSVRVASQNPHMICVSYDLPPVSPIALENVSKMGMAERVKVQSGDFFTDTIPSADVIVMGNILHGFGLEDKRKLIERAYNALPSGGAFVVIENIIDNERRNNSFGLLMSLNMLIESAEGFDFTEADFNDWVMEAGFDKTTIMPLAGPTSAVIAFK